MDRSINYCAILLRQLQYKPDYGGHGKWHHYILNNIIYLNPVK